MQNSSKFFCNKECEYWPCHQGIEPEDINCLFCYCPLYQLEECPGDPVFYEHSGRRIKDCSGCTWNHDPAHYDWIMRFLA